MQWQPKADVVACHMPCLVTVQTQTKTRRGHIDSSELLVSRVRSLGGFHRHGQVCRLAMVTEPSISLKCLPKFATGTSSQRRWRQLVPHQARCMSAPKHWQKASSIQCPRASLKLHTASPLWPADGSRPTHCWAFFYSWPLLIKQRGRVDERDPQGWKTLTWYFDNLAGFVA